MFLNLHYLVLLPSIVPFLRKYLGIPLIPAHAERFLIEVTDKAMKMRKDSGQVNKKSVRCIVCVLILVHINCITMLK